MIVSFQAVRVRRLVFLALLACCSLGHAHQAPGLLAPTLEAAAASADEENWSIHMQNTNVLQGHAAVRSPYAGQNSLNSAPQMRQTVSLDLLLGLRLWEGAEMHLDGMMWQGFGMSNALGVAGFPNGEAFRKGTSEPNANISRAFIRQSFGLGSEMEDAPSGSLFLKGGQHKSRVVVTLGRFGAKDIFDGNAYANDARTQFMNWSLMANGAWDYPADSLGFTTGGAVELYLHQWVARYGLFQVPNVSNGIGMDPHFWKAWAQVLELERKHEIHGHPGAVRVLAYLNRAHMGSFQQTLDNPARPADITNSRAYRLKYGFCLNADQEIADGLGVFTRLGWSDGKEEAWSFTDVDSSASFGLSAKGTAWNRPNDTLAIAGIVNVISKPHRAFFQQGGTGILVGDGTMSYGPEKIIETYYDIGVTSWLHLAFDYQFVTNPAYNRDRGPVHIFGARLHWEF
ncbi:carbohydrate porin [Prosthecobacter sp.]|uniref:carbohydrate porin n=1 Tax=Prosthecobacter sp. TaxID=1965333 RepID=UPI003783C591